MFKPSLVNNAHRMLCLHREEQVFPLFLHAQRGTGALFLLLAKRGAGTPWHAQALPLCTYMGELTLSPYFHYTPSVGARLKGMGRGKEWGKVVVGWWSVGGRLVHPGHKGHNGYEGS